MGWSNAEDLIAALAQLTNSKQLTPGSETCTSTEVLQRRKAKYEYPSKNRTWIDRILEESVSGSSNGMDFRVCRVDTPAQIVRIAVGRSLVLRTP